MKTLNRRTLLRGAGGAAIALPFLDAMGDPKKRFGFKTAHAATGFPKRLLIVNTGNGCVNGYKGIGTNRWSPTGTPRLRSQQPGQHSGAAHAERQEPAAPRRLRQPSGRRCRRHLLRQSAQQARHAAHGPQVRAIDQDALQRRRWRHVEVRRVPHRGRHQRRSGALEPAHGADQVPQHHDVHRPQSQDAVRQRRLRQLGPGDDEALPQLEGQGPGGHRRVRSRQVV